MPLEMGARVDKIGINAQYAKICQESKGKIDYDKSFIHLPRQHLSFDDGGVGDDLPREGGAFGGQDIC